MLGRAGRFQPGSWERHRGENCQWQNRRVPTRIEGGLYDRDLHAKRSSRSLQGSNRSVDHGIRTLHRRKEKDRQDAENGQHSQFASDAARNHSRTVIIA